MNGSDMFSNQVNTGGTIAGASLEGSLFIKPQFGLVFVDDAGQFWKLQLAQNPNGTTFIAEDGKPTVALIQVSF